MQSNNKDDRSPLNAGQELLTNRDAQIDICFSIPAQQRLRFTEDVLNKDFPRLLDVLEPSGPDPTKVQVWVDSGLLGPFAVQIEEFVERLSQTEGINVVSPLESVPGGEGSKRDPELMRRIWSSFNEFNMDRRSYVIVIGGGAVLDAVGYAAGTAHRGIRLVRIPTTTLSQADSGVGVKNAINYFDKKNWLGTFAVPWAVINDAVLVERQPDREFRAGFSEAVKVSLLKDAETFNFLCEKATAIRNRDMEMARHAIRQSILMHLGHIAYAGDPFEARIARPLDFGHWSAHKLEPMTRYRLRHGEAVAIGVALDCLYSSKKHGLSTSDALRVLQCLSDLGLPTAHPLLSEKEALFAGLEEFRQHLGGELTVTMLDAPGAPIDVHEIDYGAMDAAIDELIECSSDSSQSGAMALD